MKPTKMQKILTILIVFVFLLSGCKSPSGDMSGFSYERDKKMYAENAGAKSSGFVNTTEMSINSKADAIDRAKNECTVLWDSTQVDFDSAAKIWRVVFYLKGTDDESWIVGGGQSVYLNEKGKTVLIVYGE